MSIWCGEAGHSRAQCPKRKGQRAPLKHVGEDDENEDCFFCVAEAGFEEPKKTARPKPRGATLGDFVLSNRYKVFEEPSKEPKRP